jgi:hypothetical protein
MLNKIFGKNKNDDKNTGKESLKPESIANLLYPSKDEKKVEKTIPDSEQQQESPKISELEMEAISSSTSMTSLTEDQIITLPTELQSIVSDAKNEDNFTSKTEENNDLSELKPDHLPLLFKIFVANYDFNKFKVDVIPKESLTDDQTLAYNDSIENLKTNIAKLKKLGFQELAKSFDSALKKLGINDIDSEGGIIDDKQIRIFINKDSKNMAMLSVLLVPALASYSAVMLYYLAPTVFTIGASAGLGALTVEYIKSKIEESKSNNQESSVKAIQIESVRAILYPILANKST